RDGLGRTTLLTTPSPERVLKTSAPSSCRVSPIFRAIPSAARDSPIREGVYIGLLCPLRAFEFIGAQPTELKQHLWFSHGIASVLYFSTSEEEIKRLCQEQK